MEIVTHLRPKINQWTLRYGKHRLKWWDITFSEHISPDEDMFFGPTPWVLALYSVYIHVPVLRKWDFAMY